MARTVAQIIAAARSILQDEVPPYRYSDAALAGYVSEAVTETRRVRPDLFLTTLRDAIPLYTQDNLATEIPLPDEYYSQVVNYVAGRADIREDSFAQDGRAATLITSFGAAVSGRRT